MASLSQLTRKLIDNPKQFSESDIDRALTLILKDETIHEVQIAAFLASSRATNRDHTPEFLATAVSNLKKEAKIIRSAPYDATFVDIVGTGGDGHDTFNVSTTSAIIAAGTGLVKVAKHGGPASTSASGASDLLTHLGVDLNKVNDASVGQLLAESEFVYMSGPVFHPVLARVKSIRKNLGIPTIFNLVGPLLNPASVRARVLGVYTPSLGRTYAEAARRLFPNTRALVVCGAEGLDEISPAGPTHVWELAASGEITEYVAHPTPDFGLPIHTLEEVASGTPKQNADLVYQLVNNKLCRGHPIRDYVLLNTAGLLYISGEARSFKEGVELANESIDEGGAKRALEKFVSAIEKL